MQVPWNRVWHLGAEWSDPGVEYGRELATGIFGGGVMERSGGACSFPLMYIREWWYLVRTAYTCSG